MNELERLDLLRDILLKATFSRCSGLGNLANGIELLCDLIEDLSPSFEKSRSSLWGALEIIGVNHQETGTEITDVEISDLKRLTHDLIGEVEIEINKRSIA